MDKLYGNDEWKAVGKTIRQLIAELESFDDKELLVEISIDGGVSGKPISLVGKKCGKCMLIHVE